MHKSPTKTPTKVVKYKTGIRVQNDVSETSKTMCILCNVYISDIGNRRKLFHGEHTSETRRILENGLKVSIHPSLQNDIICRNCLRKVGTLEKAQRETASKIAVFQARIHSRRDKVLTSSNPGKI